MSTYLVKHAQSSRRRDWLANSEQARTDLSKALPERKVRVFAPSLRDIPKRLEHIVIRAPEKGRPSIASSSLILCAKDGVKVGKRGCARYRARPFGTGSRHT